jgi:hypothetical protein
MNLKKNTRIRCYTLFDLTPTNISNQLKVQQLPYTTKGGLTIHTEDDLTRARNQQRNWETVKQLLGLRTQAEIDIEPYVTNDASLASIGLKRQANKIWAFEFSTEFAEVYDIKGQRLQGLIEDFDSIPMLTGLDEDCESLEPYLTTQGPRINTRFVEVDEQEI